MAAYYVALNLNIIYGLDMISKFIKTTAIFSIFILTATSLAFGSEYSEEDGAVTFGLHSDLGPDGKEAAALAHGIPQLKSLEKAQIFQKFVKAPVGQFDAQDSEIIATAKMRIEAMQAPLVGEDSEGLGNSLGTKLDPFDALVKLRLFSVENVSASPSIFRKIFGGETIVQCPIEENQIQMLPYSALRNIKEGDTLTLSIHGKVVKLTAAQPFPNASNRAQFEEVLSSQTIPLLMFSFLGDVPDALRSKDLIRMEGYDLLQFRKKIFAHYRPGLVFEKREIPMIYATVNFDLIKHDSKAEYLLLVEAPGQVSVDVDQDSQRILIELDFKVNPLLLLCDLHPQFNCIGKKGSSGSQGKEFIEIYPGDFYKIERMNKLEKQDGLLFFKLSK